MVAIGSFNPRLLSPQWFYSQKLISEKEFDQSSKNINILARTVVSFPIGDTQFEASLDRLQLSGTLLAESQIKDLTLSIFSLLEHTPVSGLGVNRAIHFDVGTEANQAEMLNRLYQSTYFNGLMGSSGLASIAVVDWMPGTDPKAERRMITIQPSVRVPFGIYVEVNHHFGTGDEKPLDLATVVSRLAESWDRILQDTKKLAEDVVKDS